MLIMSPELKTIYYISAYCGGKIVIDVNTINRLLGIIVNDAKLYRAIMLIGGDVISAVDIMRKYKSNEA